MGMQRLLGPRRQLPVGHGLRQLSQHSVHLGGMQGVVRQKTVCRLLVRVRFPHRGNHPHQMRRVAQHFQAHLRRLFLAPHLPQKGVRPLHRQKASFAAAPKGTAAVITLPPGARRAHGAVDRLGVALRYEYDDRPPGAFCIRPAKGADILQPQRLGQRPVDPLRGKIVVGVGADDGDPLCKAPSRRSGRIQPLQRVENHRVVADDAAAPHRLCLFHRRRRHIQRHQNAADLRHGTSYQKAGIIPVHAAAKRRQRVDGLVNLPSRICHAVSSFLPFFARPGSGPQTAPAPPGPALRAAAALRAAGPAALSRHPAPNRSLPPAGALSLQLLQDLSEDRFCLLPAMVGHQPEPAVARYHGG